MQQKQKLLKAEEPGSASTGTKTQRMDGDQAHAKKRKGKPQRAGS